MGKWKIYATKLYYIRSLITDLHFTRPKIRRWKGQNVGLMKMLSKVHVSRPPGGRHS